MTRTTRSRHQEVKAKKTSAKVVEEEYETSMEVEDNASDRDSSDGEDDSADESEVDPSSEPETQDGDPNHPDDEVNADILDGELLDSCAHNTASESETEEERNERKKRDKKVRKAARKDRRVSMEDKLDSLTSVVGNLQHLLIQQGVLGDPQKTKKVARQEREPSTPTRKRSMPKGKSAIVNDDQDIELDKQGVNDSESETTVYKDAVRCDRDNTDMIEDMDTEITFNFKKRDSSSSEDRIDTSDEMIKVDVNDQFIAECRDAAKKMRREGRNQQQAEVRQQVTRDAEANKARLYATPGNMNLLNFDSTVNAVNSSAYDENYMVVGAHVDVNLQHKIVNHEYCDFAKLLPKGRVTREEDNRMEIVNRGGSTYFVPVSERENAVINCFAKWEQAFRVFSNIYTRAYPDRSTELIQYNHIIFTASSKYSWENVYMYDKEFRIHMGNYPQRKWSIILQQAWSMYLVDRVSDKTSPEGFNTSSSNPSTKFVKSNEMCRRYNKGLCTRGARCRYQHKCMEPISAVKERPQHHLRITKAPLSRGIN